MGWWQGCLELLKRSGVAISGKRAVVLGRSNIVGMPVAHLLQARSPCPPSPKLRAPHMYCPGWTRTNLHLHAVSMIEAWF